MLDAVRRFLAAHAIEPCHLLIACSGGVDSTALLLVASDLRADGFTISAGHVNHHLRGDESDGDETFVRDLCARLVVPLHVVDGTIDDDAIRDHGLEGAARDVRYAGLGAIRDKIGARYVATAHQKNDQAETVLMRMVSGTGLAGLRGIHAIRDDGWIRPLLEITRAEIDAYLRLQGVTPRIDRTNADTRFLRNRVRAALREFDSSAIDNLAAVAEQAAEVWPAFERMLDAVERGAVVATDDETRFLRWPDDPWLRQALLNRHIRRLGGSRDISAADLRRLAAEADDIRRVSVTRNLEMVLRDRAVILRRKPERVAEFQVALTAPASAFIGEIASTITIAETDESAPMTRSRASQIFSLPQGAAPHFVVRNRRTGDRFQPLGMERDKKLKDFLIDRKIGAETRDAIPLLIWNGEIVWVAGVEVSDRFKVTGRAGSLYEVRLEHGARGDEEDRDDLQR